MATLTSTEKARIRNFIEQKALSLGIPIAWNKAALDDSAQAVETLIANNAAAISNAIDAASQPHGITFTPAQKKFIVAVTLFVKYLRDS